MHGASEQVLQIVLQGGQIEQAPTLAELYEHVHIALGSCIAAGDRPEHAHLPRAVPLRDTRDLNPATTQLLDAGWGSGGARVWIRAAAALNLTAALGELVQCRVFLLGRDRHR